MNPTPITTEELLALTKSADLLRQTAEKAMRFDEADRLLLEHIRSWERVRDALPDVNDTGTAATPLVDRVLHRLGLVDSLKKELEVVGNHAICRLNVLGEINRVLGSDGGETGANTLTGVPPHLYRLPKRIEQLVGEMNKAKIDRDAWEDAANDWKGEYHKEVEKCQSWRDEFVKAENQVKELLRENETLARNMPPEPPVEELDKRPGIVQVMDYSTALDTPSGVPRIIGQAWCKTDRATTDRVNFAFKFDMQTHYIVLCNVLQDVQTGALTYHPVAVKDLPVVQ